MIEVEGLCKRFTVRERSSVLGKETRTWAQRFHQEAQKTKREARPTVLSLSYS